MNKVQMYYRTSLRRENLALNFIYNLFLWVCSYPRLMLEVFVRKNLGQRYFRMSSAITVAAILFFMPKISSTPRWVTSLFGVSRGSRYDDSSAQFTWYLFITLFVIFSVIRWFEIEKLSSGFNFNKYTKYSGDINYRFSKIPFFGQTDIRQVETFWEPLFFFLIGGLLILLGQKIGIVIFIGSIMYCISYCAAYKNGDDFIADANDERLLEEEFHNSYVKNLPGEQCRGVRLYMDRPRSMEEAEKVAEYMLKPETEDAVFQF